MSSKLLNGQPEPQKTNDLIDHESIQFSDRHYAFDEMSKKLTDIQQSASDFYSKKRNDKDQQIKDIIEKMQ